MGVSLISQYLVTYPGMVAWWAAPVYSITDIAWTRFKQILTPIAHSIHNGHKHLVLANGAELWCKTANDPDNLRGVGIDFIVFDEAAYIKQLNYVWQAVVRPMLTDSGGTMLAMSTPSGGGTFQHWFNKGQDQLDSDWQSWNFPTHANTHLRPEELEKLDQEYPPGSDLYRQEILGEFLPDAGQVFTKVHELATAAWLEAPLPGRVYVAGVDWGKDRDYTVMVIVDRGSREVVFYDRFQTMDYIDQRARIVAHCHRFDVVDCVVELNSIGQPNFEMLYRMPTPANGDGRAFSLPVRGLQVTPRNKRGLVERLALAFQLNEITIPDDPVLINELLSYRRAVSERSGTVVYSGPDDGHDDCVMALVMAWDAVEGPGFGFGIAEV